MAESSRNPFERPPFDRPPFDKDELDKAAKAAADVFIYAPIGLAREVSKQLPNLVKSGRDLVEGPLAAAKVMGKFAMDQQRKKAQQAGERVRDVVTPQPKHADHGVDPAKTKATPTPEHAPDPASLAIEGYNTLSASQILARLTDLTPEQLERIEAYEQATRARKTILARITQLRAS